VHTQRRFFLLGLVAVLAACAQGPRISVEAGAPPPAIERPFATFREAALAFDVEAARRLAGTNAEREYAGALGLVRDGRLPQAQAALLLLATGADSRVAAMARGLVAFVAHGGVAPERAAFTSEVDRSFAEWLHRFTAEEKRTIPAQGVSVSFSRGPTDTPLVPVTLNGFGTVLGLDTGAHMTVLGSLLADAVGARRLGSRTAAKDVHEGTVEAELAIVDLEIGGMRLEGHPVVIVDASNLRFGVAGNGDTGFDGLIGWNAIRELRVQIDNGARTIRFAPSKAGAFPVGDLFWVGEPHVRARAGNGFPLTLFLDTGASRTTIATTLAASAGLANGEARSTVVFGAAGSRRLDMTAYRDAVLYAGGVRLRFPELQAVAPRATSFSLRDGVLGADALTEGLITIDYPAREFSIRR
jgi:predicted aspartyl protease